MYVHVKCSSSHAQNTLQPHRQSMKLRIMIQVKGADQIWSIRDDMCRTESQKAMKCVPFVINVCTCEMLILTCTEHTSTTSPVNKTQDYDCLDVNKGNDQIWKFRDDMCRIESPKCVPFAIKVCKCEMLFLTCIEHTSTTSPVNETQDYDY